MPNVTQPSKPPEGQNPITIQNGLITLLRAGVLTVNNNGELEVDEKNLRIGGPDSSLHDAASLPTFSDESTADANTTEGDIVYVQSTNSAYIQDGT